jgi:acyl-homoserine lactone synthase
MHRDRKRVFVDLLHWDVPVVDDAFEVDAFDTEHAVYLVATDTTGIHLGSFRLLPSERPHLLGSVFPHLCDDAVPSGSGIWEITRGCLSPALRATERLRTRNQLATAAVHYALVHGITCYTCVADSGWLAQIPALGWETRPLGAPRRIAGVLTGALEMRITSATPERFRAAGTYAAAELVEGVRETPLAA